MPFLFRGDFNPTQMDKDISNKKAFVKAGNFNVSLMNSNQSGGVISIFKDRKIFIHGCKNVLFDESGSNLDTSM